MKPIRLAMAVAIVGLLVGVAQAQLPRSLNRPKDVPPPPPTSFVLRQNVPDPFCAGAIGGFTTIEFALPQLAVVALDVLSPDGSALVKRLVNGSLQAGYHAVAWDGRDALGVPVPTGAYPYRLTARESGSGAVLYETSLTATVSCPVPSGATTWGFLKLFYFATVH